MSLEENYMDDGRLTYKAQVRILAPEEKAGQFHYETFWIGNDEDPEGHNVEAFVWRGMKNMCNSVGVKLDDEDLDIVCEQVKGQQVGFRVYETASKKEPGKMYSNTNWLKAGEVTPQLRVSKAQESQQGNTAKPQTPPIPPAGVPSNNGNTPAAAPYPYGSGAA
jgi:hypothetical protein